MSAAVASRARVLGVLGFVGLSTPPVVGPAFGLWHVLFVPCVQILHAVLAFGQQVGHCIGMHAVHACISLLLCHSHAYQATIVFLCCMACFEMAGQVA
jgi:hypothetical protein